MGMDVHTHVVPVVGRKPAPVSGNLPALRVCDEAGRRRRG